ncbi:hypothetical protein TNCV_167221 [Trichonephila clavipes]|nr:hypothetical protein TNCV_167221 [Trichonephila clavipes]
MPVLAPTVPSSSNRREQVGLFAARRTSHNRLGDSLGWRAVRRLEGGQSQAEVARWLQVTQKWSPGYGINSKQIVLSPRRSPKSIDVCTGSLLVIKRAATQVVSGSFTCS